MMQFRGALKKLNFDAAGFRKALDQQLQVQTRKAATAWLAAAIGRVPVYTGTARGTFRPLAQVLRVALEINPIAFRKFRGPEYGASQSAFEFTASDGIYGFRFNQDLDYYLMNDLGVVRNIPSTPWKSMEAAKAAYDAYMKETLLERIPKLTDYLTSSEVTIG